MAGWGIQDPYEAAVASSDDAGFTDPTTGDFIPQALWKAMNPDRYYNAGAGGEPSGRNKAPLVWGSTPSPTAGGDTWDMLMSLWKGRRSIGVDRDKARREADDAILERMQAARSGGGGNGSPWPDVFRWSPQSGPTIGTPGVTPPGAAPIRPTVGPQNFTDPYQDPHPGADPDAITRALQRVTLVPGQQPLDFSDPSKIGFPGVTSGMLPSPYMQKNQRMLGSDRSTIGLGSTGGPHPSMQFAPPGAPSSWAPAPGDEQADYDWFHNTNPFLKAWITQFQPQNRRMHPFEKQFRSAGITPEKLTYARGLKGAGVI